MSSHFLLSSHGLIRSSSNINTQRINPIYIDPHNAHKALMKLHYADLTDASSLSRWLDTIAPDEVYNLVAQSHVAVSFEIPDYTADVVATGALRLLEAVRNHVDSTERTTAAEGSCLRWNGWESKSCGSAVSKSGSTVMAGVEWRVGGGEQGAVRL